MAVVDHVDLKLRLERFGVELEVAGFELPGSVLSTHQVLQKACTSACCAQVCAVLLLLDSVRAQIQAPELRKPTGLSSIRSRPLQSGSIIMVFSNASTST